MIQSKLLLHDTFWLAVENWPTSCVLLGTSYWLFMAVMIFWRTIIYFKINLTYVMHLKANKDKNIKSSFRSWS